MDNFNSSMIRRRKLPPLGALRAFEAAARHMSFQRAAEELSVTPTAVSHQIRLLEDTLSQPLFVRRVRGVTLTEAGLSLYPTLRDGLDAFERAVETIRLSSPTSFGHTDGDDPVHGAAASARPWTPLGAPTRIWT